MSRIIAITNQKGGVGKTTTAINLAASLAHLGQGTLLVDIDPQANATSGLGWEKKKIGTSVYQVLLEEIPASKAILPTQVEGLALLPASLDLIGAEVELATEPARETRLKKALEEVRPSYRYIFIDCPPSLGLLTLNALTACDSVLIPVQCEYYALEGLAQLMTTLERIKTVLNPQIEVEGAVMTLYDSRISLANQVLAELKKFFGDKLYPHPIPRNIRLAEAPSFGQPILTYDPSSRGCEAYLALARELISRTPLPDSAPVPESTEPASIGSPLAEELPIPVPEARS